MLWRCVWWGGADGCLWVWGGWFTVISNLDVVITLSRFVELGCCLVVSFCVLGWICLYVGG